MSSSRMTLDYAHLSSGLSDPLFLDGVFLVVGFLVTRLIFDDRPVARFLCQLTSFAVLTIMLRVSGATPFHADAGNGSNASLRHDRCVQNCLVARGFVVARWFRPCCPCL
jgi:hypothetical protein